MTSKAPKDGKQIAKVESPSLPTTSAREAVAPNPAALILEKTLPIEKFVRRCEAALRVDWRYPQTERDVRKILEAIPSRKHIENLIDPLAAIVHGDTDIPSTKILLADLSGALPTSAGCSRASWLCATLDCLQFDDFAPGGFSPQLVARAYRETTRDRTRKFLPAPGEFLGMAREASRDYARVLEELDYLDALREAADAWKLDDPSNPDSIPF